MRVECTCQQCGETFLAKPCRVAYGQAKYCSVLCTATAKTIPAEGRAWRLVDTTAGPDACWPWLGALAHGYGSMRGADGRTTGAHRVIYQSMRGPIPDGLELDHLCRNRSCVNPAHLEPVTRIENARRIPSAIMRAHVNGTCTRGHPLTEDNTYHHPSRTKRECLRCRRNRGAGRPLE